MSYKVLFYFFAAENGGNYLFVNPLVNKYTVDNLLLSAGYKRCYETPADETTNDSKMLKFEIDTVATTLQVWCKTSRIRDLFSNLCWFEIQINGLTLYEANISA